MADRPFDAPNLLRHAAGRLHGFPDISEDLLDAAAEIERLRAEAARADELQALIDAWAATVGWIISSGHTEHERATAALLAAVTEGGDR